ncbi:Y-family DNA polymerase [Gracilimonas mengyeensis]|uniref:DNA polymerase V n=1 Tax=Gracilimonas mengyeensis TaxID=1302730 RepID=A0A521E1P2_9BACT|nr:Y-family DNA polymerase [Gracilimonas mengyeensis]SMO77858.1 DNA polymerase V [Gracilimonas mengyeensis]
MNLPQSFESRRSIAYAMIDCNNFYASCERVFNPALEGKPIVILSNNDGCVIARSEEAKALEIPMGAPAFKYQNYFRQNHVVMRSSNYPLYGDMSRRVMDTLRDLTHDIEVYSIDEAFAELSTNTYQNLDEYGRIIKETIYKWTGLPVSVGIAPSKTLAKIANETAKRNAEFRGVLNLCDHPGTNHILKKMPLKKIWGIGHGLTVRLNRHHIETALDLKQTINNKRWVRKHLNVTGLRTVLELNGLPCMKISEALESRKGILTSRMFGKPLFELEPIEEAVATYISRGAEKLRAQGSVASNLQVTLIGDKFKNPKSKYKYSAYTSFKVPTAHTPTLIESGKRITRSLHLPDTKYKKAAIMLTGLVPHSEVQMDLFDPELYTQKQFRLMECMDQINTRHGRNTAAFAATGLHKKEGQHNKWTMKQNYLSKQYTTRWEDIMTAKAK